jgi:hypothetical protein
MTMPMTHPPRRWLPRLAPALALVLATGCASAKSASTSSAQAPDLPMAETVDVTGMLAANQAEAPGFVGYDGEYDFREDMVGTEAPPPDAAVIASRGRKELGKAREWGPPTRTKPGEPSVTEPSKDEAKAKADDKPDHGRQIVYTAGLQVSVYALEAAMATVEAVPERFGGWVHMRTQQQVVLRLPADQLKPVMAELATLGVVEARTLQAQDVTAEYVDLDSRIKVLRDTQTQLLSLLEQAKTVEEALHVRRALDEVTMQLELALGRMRQLSDLIAYSTLTVTLVERGPQDHIPTSNDPFGWVDSLGVEATEWR